MDNTYGIVFSKPASIEMQSVFLDITAQRGRDAAKEELANILAEIEKLRDNPFLGYEVPRNRPPGHRGRVVARRGLRLLQIGKYLAYYKVSQSDVNIFHFFEYGTRYPSIVRRDLGEDE